MENELASLPPAEEVIPPVEPTAPEVPPETPPVEPSGPPGEPPAPDEPPDPAALTAEMEELERKRQKLEEDAKYWRTEKARARADFFRDQKGAEPPATPPVTPTEPGTEPHQGDFEDYSDYVKALTDYKVKQARTGWDADAAKKDETAEYQTKETALQVGLQKGFEKYPDFEEVALDITVPITETVKMVLAEKPETAADVAYYLGKNRSEAIQLSRMNPVQAARKIAEIEINIANNPASPPNKTTNAPPPVTPVGSSNVIEKDEEKMTQKEFEAHRLAQGARRF